jgi:hypothetical protein
MVEYYHPPAADYFAAPHQHHDYTQQEEEWDREGLLDPVHFLLV